MSIHWFVGSYDWVILGSLQQTMLGLATITPVEADMALGLEGAAELTDDSSDEARNLHCRARQSASEHLCMWHR